MSWNLIIANFAALVLAVVSARGQTSERQVALTIDDLPAMSAATMSATEITEMTRRLLAQLKQESVPAVAFVNEGRLYQTGQVDERIRALTLWLESGFELGNHTFSHASLNQHSLPDWEEDVIRGETVTKLLLEQHHQKLRYVRHPFLDTGRDLLTRRRAEEFLTARGYRIAPVTMDGFDWLFAGVYEDARTRGDTTLETQAVKAYLTYTEEVFAGSEKRCRDLLGYEPKQILLLHANWLKAEHLAELCRLLRSRGYRFITLEQALSDQAYSLPDDYVGEFGTTWITHWAVTRGQPQPEKAAPAIPSWVRQRAKTLNGSP